jgi:type II secretion system protein N
MKSSKTFFLYTLYTLAALLVFLYVRFPSQTIRDVIVTRVGKAQPELQITTEGAYPVFPPGLKLEPLALAYSDIPIVRMEYLKVVPGLISLFRQQKEMDFSGPLGSGSLKGYAEIALEERRPKINVVMNLAGVPVESLELLDMWPDYKLVGEMNSYINFDSRKGAGGTTVVNTDIAPARIVFNAPLMGIEQMDFTQIVAEMTVTPRMLQITRCEAFGTQIEGKMTGSIIFRQPLQNSRITLSCTLKPQPAFAAEHKNDMLGGLLGSETAQKRGVVFRISGTLGNPSYVVR